MDYPDLNRETIELMHAIEFEIRRRPLDEQYPEMWNPLKSANDTLRQLASVQMAYHDRQTEISGWQKHFDDHLESVFTNIALKYLREHNPGNTYVNVFEDGLISNSWKDPNFGLDGLIYMVEATFYLTESQLAKTEFCLCSNE
jgi:hypothetical protein